VAPEIARIKYMPAIDDSLMNSGVDPDDRDGESVSRRRWKR
jgi:hypothetical protein